jgi:hypothetical protein
MRPRRPSPGADVSRARQQPATSGHRPTQSQASLFVSIQAHGFGLLSVSHDQLHTHGAMLLRQDAHPKVVQERLGYASVGITLDIYPHVSWHMQSDAAETIDAGLRAALAG